MSDTPVAEFIQPEPPWLRCEHPIHRFVGRLLTCICGKYERSEIEAKQPR